LLLTFSITRISYSSNVRIRVHGAALQIVSPITVMRPLSISVALWIKATGKYRFHSPVFIRTGLHQSTALNINLIQLLRMRNLFRVALRECLPHLGMLQGRRSLWDRGDTPPIFGLGDIITNVPSIFLE